MFHSSLKQHTPHKTISLIHCIGLAALIEITVAILMACKFPSMPVEPKILVPPKSVTVMIKAPIQEKTSTPDHTPLTPPQAPPSKSEQALKPAPFIGSTTPPSQSSPAKKDSAPKKKKKSPKPLSPKNNTPKPSVTPEPKAQQKDPDPSASASLPNKTPASEQSYEEAAPLLKNLAAPTPPETVPENPSPEPHDPEDISKALSISELDAFKKQLARCWIMPASAADKAIAVTLEVQALPSGAISKVKVVAPKTKSPATRRVIKRAKATFSHPDCATLFLPKDRYDQWQSFLITFSSEN